MTPLYPVPTPLSGSRSTSIIVGVPNVPAGDASASGATLTVTTSLIDCVATGGASAAGSTLTITTSLIDGAASGAAGATGATLVLTASLIDGTATGGATVSGQTLSVTAALIDGVASGDSDATALGATLTVSLTLVVGIATGDAHFQGTGSVGRRDIKRLKKARRKMAEALERQLRALTGEAEQEAEEATIAGAPPPEAPPLIAEARAAAVTMASMLKAPQAADPPFSLEYVQDLLTRLEDFIERQDEDEALLLLAA